MIKTESFQLKADFMPLTVFKFSTPDLDAFNLQLTEVVAKAPKYFVNAPVLLDVQDLVDQQDLDFATICNELKAKQMFPIGIRGLQTKLQPNALELGLAIVNAAEKKQETREKPKEKALARRKTKIITTPVRSGAQIYAPDGDLIVMAPVNAGAEIIADGNIHVYGALRGRALAGARGDETARIFCSSMQAELVSIAGCYVVKDNLRMPKGNPSMVQIYLDGENINIEGV